MRARDPFTTIRTEGGLLPADLLARVAKGDGELDGLDPDSYHLAGGERLNEAISRAWSRLVGAWTSFQARANGLPESDLGTSLTRERWLLILFQELGYGRLQAARSVDVDGKSYPISHFWTNSPIHLVGCRVDMDRRTAGVAGAARSSPHSLVQEFLNRSDDHLWGFVSNGLCLRILRDNVSLTRQAYVEFDLKGMMDGEVYADFALLWLLCHQSRVEAERPEECWLERWARTAQEEGTRALDSLRDGVERAISALGCGFLAHPANNVLREALRSGTLSKQDYYRQLLRLVYRLLFLFVAEDRELLLAPDAGADAKGRYTRFYSTARLRRLAERRRGTKHADAYRGLRVVMAGIGNDEGCPGLALPALGSMLWSDEAIPDIEPCDIANRDLLEAVRALAFTEDERVRRSIDYKNLGSEELGSVYESLLELHPKINTEAATFNLTVAAGHERKTTGSYYTPTSLVNELIDSALGPVLEEAARKPDPEKAILDLKVCDPACGSGHFLIAAAHRMAKRLAAVRTGDEEAAPQAVRHALRDVIGHCIYGVDINPMAVELCKVSLWMEALEPGRPLSFLDHRIKCGNSLLGTTPALMARGIPDDAFKPITGDDKDVCGEYKKINRDERKGQKRLWDKRGEPWQRMGDLASAMMNLDAAEDETIEDVHAKEERYARVVSSSGYRFTRLWADMWCAAFVWKKKPGDDYPITESWFRRVERNPHDIPKWMEQEVQRLREQYRFFHWHLEFPDVFPPAADSSSEARMGEGGFDVVLGNPPWERIKLQEKEFFAGRDPEIANARNAAARRKKIRALKTEDPALYGAFMEAKRTAEGESMLVRDTDRYPLCGRGDVNTYSVFAELKRSLILSTGRVGCIVPSGIATDYTTQLFFQDLMDTGSLVSLFDFENRKGLFPEVQGNMKFCLLTMAGKRQEHVLGAAQLDDPALLGDSTRVYELSLQDIAHINPNTLNWPTFRSALDALLVAHTHGRVPVLEDQTAAQESVWQISFLAMFHMTNDSALFATKEDLEGRGFHLSGNTFVDAKERCLPLYEAKLTSQFNHRAATFAGIPPSRRFVTHAGTNTSRSTDLADPGYIVMPRFWIDSKVVADKAGGGSQWFLGFRNAISAVADSRSLVATILPFAGVGNSMPLLLTDEPTPLTVCLVACLNSFCLDYVLRQKASGGNLNYYILRQLPVPAPAVFEAVCPWFFGLSHSQWVLAHALELTYTAWNLEVFASDCGYDGPPFVWDEERRFLMRSELDAAFFHLYLGTEEEWQKEGGQDLIRYFSTQRDAADHILETFPIVKRRDEQAHGEYRTKRVILEIYDEMTAVVAENEAAVAAGRQPTARYQTRLAPPPGPPCDAQDNFLPMSQWDPANWPPHVHPPRDVHEALRAQERQATPSVMTVEAPCVYTVGHSNVGIEDWLALLKEREVEILVDLRSVPYSRHVPQANRDALEKAVKAQEMKYLFLGDELGGRPKSGVPRDGAGRPDYAQMAQREEFQEGIQRLLRGIKDYRVCLLCSEEDPARCHRALLVGRELVKKGVEVRHIRGDGTEESQEQAERRAPGRQESLFERGKS